MACAHEGCPFFAAEGWSSCSEHRPEDLHRACKEVFEPWVRSIDLVGLITGYVSSETSALRQPRQDEDLVRVLGRDPATAFYDADHILERVYFLGHHDLPYIGCDDIMSAREMTGLSGDRLLKSEDARNLMRAVLSRPGAHEYTVLAIEKVLCIDAINHAALPRELFPVGSCYYGKPKVYNTTPDDDLCRILHRYAHGNHAFFIMGGGGGGGGGL
jgi:hypothetical protein